MDFKRFILTLMFAVAFAINSPSTFASDKTDVVDAVNRYLANLDCGGAEAYPSRMADYLLGIL